MEDKVDIPHSILIEGKSEPNLDTHPSPPRTLSRCECIKTTAFIIAVLMFIGLLLIIFIKTLW